LHPMQVRYRAAPRPDWQVGIIVAFEVSCNQMTFTVIVPRLVKRVVK
jgi:hypothetical protein